jgi:hypothetical protein
MKQAHLSDPKRAASSPDDAHLQAPALDKGAPDAHLYAMVDDTGLVIGICQWDGKSERRPYTLVLAQGAEIGWKYVNPGFMKPIGGHA